MKRKNGFTLIELIAVLVILAILALIVTPLVMNIIRKARISADKRSIDAYGRKLTIEYSGNQVVCSTTKINSDSSVYLAGCTVGGREVKDYTYGSEEAAPTYTAYKVGDEVKYNNVDYYVIKNSGVNEEEVQLLKKDPLTVAQVNQYGAGHVNMYGGMAYYSSANCNDLGDSSGCTTDYAQSEVKYVVDAWKTAQAPNATNARLITLDDLKDNLGIELTQSNVTSLQITVTEDTPTWVMGENYYYWTMTTNTDKTADVWIVGTRSRASVPSNVVQVFGNVVRPVITLKKSALQS